MTAFARCRLREGVLHDARDGRGKLQGVAELRGRLEGQSAHEAFCFGRCAGKIFAISSLCLRSCVACHMLESPRRLEDVGNELEAARAREANLKHQLDEKDFHKTRRSPLPVLYLFDMQDGRIAALLRESRALKCQLKKASARPKGKSR